MKILNSSIGNFMSADLSEKLLFDIFKSPCVLKVPVNCVLLSSNLFKHRFVFGNNGKLWDFSPH